MVEYRLRQEHADQVRKIKETSNRSLQDFVAKLSVEIEVQMKPIFAFYGINPALKGFIQEKDGDVTICLPEATTASAL